MENPSFLNKKYQNLPGSKEVSRAVEETKKDPERVSLPHSKTERTQAYLNRIENIINDPRGWELLSHKIKEDFTLDLEDPEVLQKTINTLHRIDVNTAIEGGQLAEVQQTQNISQEQINDTYMKGAFEKKGSQEESLNQWLDYLKQNDAEYPVWFQYFTMRNLKKMGRFNKEEQEYSKRSRNSLDSFPELNAEALGEVYRLLNKGLGNKEYTYNPDIHTPEQKLELEAKRSHLEKLLSKKDFAGIYSFAQMESEGNSNREHLEGEWKKFEQNSDPEILEETLRNKGTGWCTATGSAEAHLQGGDFYVYYTKGDSGTYTEPRIAIRMENEQVREVRGVEHQQNLEGDLVDIAQEKYTTLPGGDKYEKKALDMKRVTALTKKHENGEELETDDLRFLYEIDGSIQGFGNSRDLRIVQLLEGRDQRTDLTKVFDCRPEQIALTQEEALTGDCVFYKGGLSLSGLSSAEHLKLPEHLGGRLFLDGLTSAEHLKLPEHLGGGLSLSGLSSAEHLKLPEHLGGRLFLDGLTSAEHLKLPEHLGGGLSLSGLSSAEHLKLPEHLGGRLFLDGLTSAEHLKLPEHLGGGLSLSGLSSAEHLKLPEHIGGRLFLDGLTSADKEMLREKYPQHAERI